MKLFYKIICVYLFLSILISCTDESSTEPSSGELITDIMPLELGREWVYEVTYYENDQKNSDIDYITLYMNHSEEREGEIYYAYQHEQEIYNYYLKRDDGFYLYSSSDKQYYMIAKYPCQVGDSFEGYGGQCIVEGINVEVECGLGLKKAIKYKSIDDDGDMLIEYYVLGIGLVRMEYYEGSEEGVFNLSWVRSLVTHDKSGDEVKLKSSSNSIQPLDVGNRWTYIYKYEEDEISENLMIRQRVVAAEESGSDKMYISILFGDEEKLVERFDGIYRYNYYYGGFFLAVKYPVVQGDKYEADVDGYKIELEVKSVDELVNTEAGEFKAVKYVGDKTDGTYVQNFELYYSEGIGLVKKIVVGKEDGVVVSKKELELKSYNLK